MAFMGRGLTSRVESVFSPAMCEIQPSKRYIKSLPLVPKDKRSCFSQGERSAVQLPLARTFCPPEIGHLIDIWKPSIL